MNNASLHYLSAMGIELLRENCNKTNDLVNTLPPSYWRLSSDFFCQWLLDQTIAQQQNLQNRSAKLLIVGDWQLLDEQTKCLFAGEAGDLLDAMLKAINLTREQVALIGLTNPASSGLADTHGQSIADVLSTQSFQLALFMCALPDNLKPADFTARVAPCATCAGIPLILSLHPAYLLSHPAAKRDVWEDLKRVRLLMD